MNLEPFEWWLFIFLLRWLALAAVSFLLYRRFLRWLFKDDE